MEFFKAFTQYGDWKGTAAADEQNCALRKLLDNKGLIERGEFLIAVTLHVLERHFTAPYLHAFVFHNGESFESIKEALATIEGPIPVRQVDLKLTTEEFLGLFKQFNVMLTWHGLELEGREYSVVES